MHLSRQSTIAHFRATRPLKIKVDERASWYSHKAETARPYYYSAYLADYDVTAEVAPTNRTWISRDEILAGGTLRFDMGPTPNKNWGTGRDSAPDSMTARGIAK